MSKMLAYFSLGVSGLLGVVFLINTVVTLIPGSQGWVSLVFVVMCALLAFVSFQLLSEK